MATERVETGSQTLARGLSALAMIGESERPLTVGELAERLGVHRSMAYRLVKTLESHGFVERLASGDLTIGARLVAVARGASRDLQSAASPELGAVADDLDMTAFLVTLGGEDEGFSLRWFTPAVEVDLCGHATLASAHVLWESGTLEPHRRAVFSTRSGRLSATKRGDEIELDFPEMTLS